uniref:Ubiquitin carboxyl-terminal hydrolase n=1 Tax=Mola mola TaxID=94237 RepID=A0A3Q4C0X7_MOLML
MDRCKHVGRLRLGHDHSILNPQKWHCVDCSTTESVWACLKCSHVACGRFMEEHSLKHFQESHHPLAMEVRELDVFCFACGDYVLNDNAEGDLKLLRGALSTVRSPGARSLRSSTGGVCTPWVGERGPQPAMQLALRHRRKALLRKMLQMWISKHQELQNRRKEKLEEARRQKKDVKRRLMEELGNVPPRKSARLLTQAPRSTITLIPRKFLSRRRLAPGVTGLRNLGNTCYMNSILQVLSHLQKFRECFLTLDLCETEELLAKTNHSQGMKGVTAAVVSSGNTALSGCPLGRMGKADSWNLPMGKKEVAPPPPQAAELVQAKAPRCSTRQQMSLCHELHTLFRVMWSGRWSLVSPFAMLHSVWNLIPAFRGYDQQDAQEFLCELLDKVQQELDTEGPKRRIVIPITKRKLSKQVLKVLNTIFHGQLLSQVTCLSCKHKSNTVEPFWDLSLEFPERYHSIGKASGSTAYQRSCTLTEMLSKFTEMEALEGSIYACNHCNRKRRKSSHKPLVLSEACKQLLIYLFPLNIKIGVHVAFDQVLNIKPYCCTGSGHSVHRGGYTYDLSAVVMHHGKGFGSGHYTAYCYNTEGGFWVHCNDSEMKVCSVEEVCNTQAYILFYTQRSKMHLKARLKCETEMWLIPGMLRYLRRRSLMAS